MKKPYETERLRNLRDALLTGLVERDLAVRLALIASLAGEHLLMVGPPGTAKSLVARRLHLAFAKSSYFERLLTRFTVPEELFGPLSIKGLEEDRYERLTAAYLPTASIAFLDEIFKANSAILNSLLTLLNEREFDNGTRREKTPLMAVIGASNELPDSEELGALFDRFLLRLHVGSVSKEGFAGLLNLRGHATPDVPESLKLSDADVVAVQAAAETVDVPADVVALLSELREWCAAESVQVSDRRWRKIVKLLQVSALTNGRETVSIWDCWLLQHCLWNKAEDREKIYQWYAARVGASAAMNPSQLTRIVTAREGQLKKDQTDQSQMRDEQGRLLFRSSDGTPTFEAVGSIQAKRGIELLYLSPSFAWSANQRKLQDRTNDGKGYTVDEIGSLKIRDDYGSLRDIRHWDGHDAYFSESSNRLIENGNLELMMEPTRHKQIYIDDCLRQIDEEKTKVIQYQAKLSKHIQTLEAQIKTHLWVTPDFAAPAAENLKQTQHAVEVLLTRIKNLQRGFAALPSEVDLPDYEEGDEADQAEEETVS